MLAEIRIGRKMKMGLVRSGLAGKLVLSSAIVLLTSGVANVAAEEAPAGVVAELTGSASQDRGGAQTDQDAIPAPGLRLDSSAMAVGGVGDAVEISAAEHETATPAESQDTAAGSDRSLSSWRDGLEAHVHDASAKLGPKLTGLLVAAALATALAAVLYRIVAGFMDNPRMSWGLFTLAATSATGYHLFAYNPAQADVAGLGVAIVVSVVVSGAAAGVLGHWWYQDPPTMPSVKVGVAAIVPAAIMAVTMSLPDGGSGIGIGAVWPFVVLGGGVGVIGGVWLLFASRRTRTSAKQVGEPGCASRESRSGPTDTGAAPDSANAAALPDEADR